MHREIRQTIRAPRPTIDARMLVACGLFATASLAGEDSSVQPFDSNTDRVPLYTVIPDYPEKARRERIEGEVQVCFDVSRKGYPRRIAVRRSTHRVFEKPAMKAVRRSRFAPLEKGEELAAIKACRTFRFWLVRTAKPAAGRESG